MAAYLDTDDVDALIGASERQALFSDTNTAAGYTEAYFTRMNELASAIIQSAAKNAGYEVGATTTDDLVKMATMGQLLSMLYTRKGISVPAAWAPYVALRDDLINGQLPLAASPTVANSVGGFSWSDQTSSTANGGNAAIFTRTKMSGY